MKRFSLLALAALLTASIAHAGYLQPAAIFFDDTGNPGHIYAHADLLSAAYDEDSEAFIGCGMRTVGFFTWGFCQASSAANRIKLTQEHAPGCPRSLQRCYRTRPTARGEHPHALR